MQFLNIQMLQCSGSVTNSELLRKHRFICSVIEELDHVPLEQVYGILKSDLRTQCMMPHQSKPRNCALNVVMMQNVTGHKYSELTGFLF